MLSGTQSPSMRSLESSAAPTAAAEEAAAVPAVAPPVEASAAAADAAKKKKQPVPGPQYQNAYGYAGKDCVPLIEHRKYGDAIDDAKIRRMKNLLFAPTHITYRTLEATMGHAPTNDELDGVWTVLPFVMRDNTKFSRPVVAALFQPWENAMNETVSESRLVYMVYGTDTSLKPHLIMYNLDGTYSEALSANMIVYKPQKCEWCKEAFVDYQAKRVMYELKQQLQRSDLAENSEFRIPVDQQAVSKLTTAIESQNLRASLLVFAGCGSEELGPEARLACDPFSRACNREYVDMQLTPLLGRLAFGSSAPRPAPPAATKPNGGTSGRNTLVFVPTHKQSTASSAGATEKDGSKKRPSAEASSSARKNGNAKKKKHNSDDDGLEYSDASLSSSEEDSSGSESDDSEEDDSEEASDEEHSEDGSSSESEGDAPTPAPKAKKAVASQNKHPPAAPAKATKPTKPAVVRSQPESSSAPAQAKVRTAKDRRTQIVAECKRALDVLDKVGDFVPLAQLPKLTAKLVAVRQAQSEYGAGGSVGEHSALIRELTNLVMQLGEILTTIGSQNDSTFPSARVSRAAAVNLAKLYLEEEPKMEAMSANLSEMLSTIGEMRTERLRVVQDTERLGAQLSLLQDTAGPSGTQDN